MSTYGNFTPPQVPECTYAPRMTRAAALARRTAGTLDPNCVVVITDGPVIGTAGNTSPTEIELQPVTSTDLGSAALVHTTFDNVAFSGSYDIDSGAAGSLTELTDHWHNKVSDVDANAPTVHTQFPYHRAGPNLRDNSINDCTLTGWATAAGSINDNALKGSTVVLTGVTDPLSRFEQNTLNESSFTSAAPRTTVAVNSLTSATVGWLGTGALGFQNNVMVSGLLTSNAATSAPLVMNNNVIGGYRVALVTATGASVIVSGNRLFGQGPSAQDLLIGGARPLVSVDSNAITAGDIQLLGAGAGSSVLTGNVLNGAVITQNAAATNPLAVTSSEATAATLFQSAAALGATALSVIGSSRVRDGFIVGQEGTGGITISGSELRNHGPAAGVADLSQQGGGLVTVADSEITAGGPGVASQTIVNQATTGTLTIDTSQVLQSLGPVVTRLAGASGGVSISGSSLNAARLVHGATNTGSTAVSGAAIGASVINHNGAGALSVSAGTDAPRGLAVTMAAGSTRGLALSGGTYSDATITQNRTGGTGVDTFDSSYVRGQSSVTLNGAVNPGAGQTLLSRVAVDAASAVTIADPAVSTVLQNCDVFNAALTLPAGALLTNACRFFRCTVNVGAFAHDSTIVDGPFATAFTATNNQRLANKAFSDVI